MRKLLIVGMLLSVGMSSKVHAQYGGYQPPAPGVTINLNSSVVQIYFNDGNRLRFNMVGTVTNHIGGLAGLGVTESYVTDENDVPWLSGASLTVTYGSGGNSQLANYTTQSNIAAGAFYAGGSCRIWAKASGPGSPSPAVANVNATIGG